MSAWVRKRLGTLYRIRDERAGDRSASLPLMSVSQIHGVVPRSDLTSDVARAADLTNYKVCHVNDLVINRMSAYNGALGVARENGLVSPDYLVLSVRGSESADFIAHWLRTPAGIFQMVLRLRGIGTPEGGQVRTPRINESELRSIEIEVPAHSTQKAIVALLDHETARIDLLITKQEHLIAVLRERRLRALAHAFEPAPGRHRLRLRHLLESRPTYGVLVPSYDDGPNAVPYVRVGDLNSLGDITKLRGIDSQQSEEYRRTILRGGEVLLGVVGGMGQAAVVPVGLAGANVARAVAVLRCREGDDAPHLAAWLSSFGFLLQAGLATSGDSVQPTLGMADLAGFELYWPVNDRERDAQHSALAAQLRDVDTLINKAERFITLSKERRSALIAAAVTGQIDVGDKVA